jgi:soluble lytic murein transglycosylase
MYQVMKLYPESAEAREIANGFDNYEKQDDKLFFTIVEVYLQNREYNLLTRKLELYIIRTPNPALKEKARFYLLQIYFEQGQYQSALYGFKNLLAGLHNEALRPRVCLMMARCYLYLGKRNEAAEQYLQYAKLFPRRRVAAESIWKAGWIYEDLGKLSTAEKLYQDLIRQWPRSDFAWEARFRRGLIPYRLDQFDRAIGAFKEIAGNQESLFQQHRGRYWLAKTYQKMGRQRSADSLFIGLGKELFDSYYAAKSYTMYHSLIDSLLDLPEKLAAANNPLKPYVESIGLWLADFEDVFAIREILGDDFALQEISENYHQPGSLKEWVALAEMYKRFGAYNRSFRIYDYINQKYFTDVASIDKPFLLKEYYPFYYDHLIATYCSKRNLDSRLVLALIREESAYDRQIRSYANAYGLMQIIPVTALEIAGDLDIEFSKPENLFNAELNINMGTYYLRKLLNRYDDTIEFALAAYNAGPHRVNRWKKIEYNDEMDIFIENIEFQQTRNYVRRVMKNYLIYSILDNIMY